MCLSSPKLFKYHRTLLGKLCLCAWETIKEFFAACLPEVTVPDAVISIQTWGNMGAKFHPHLHDLVSKGAFDAHGVFYPLPWIDTQKMALLFREKVFTMHIQEGKITVDLAEKTCGWPHSGFNIHNEVQIDAYHLPLKRYAVKNGLNLLSSFMNSILFSARNVITK